MIANAVFKPAAATGLVTAKADPGVGLKNLVSTLEVAMSTIERQIACAKKELKRRKRVFPYLIESGKLTEDEATAEIALMLDIYETLTQLKGLVLRGC